jgi:pimeloyl-ACP methyl ester carboxylesterase
MDLVFDRRGSGEPLVLIHGLGSRWQAFEPVLPFLVDDFEVWSVDMPGFGASAPLPGRTDIDALTDAIAGWMGAEGIEGPHVAGNSTGGGVALELAARGVVASACALAPIGFWSARERAFTQASMAATRRLSTLTRPFSAAMARNPAVRYVAFRQYLAKPGNMSVEDIVESVDALVGAPAFDDVNAAFTGYLAPEDAADDVPVTICWGAKDALLLPRQLERAKRRLPRARHVLLPTAGHLMMYDEPEAVAGVIRAATRAPAPIPA